MSIIVDHAARGEDVRWLAQTGESASGAAARIGISYDALEKWCRAHDRESWQLLYANEPRDHNKAAPFVAGYATARRKKVA